MRSTDSSVVICPFLHTPQHFLSVIQSNTPCCKVSISGLIINEFHLLHTQHSIWHMDGAQGMNEPLT